MRTQRVLLGALVLALAAAPVTAEKKEADANAPMKFRYLKMVIDGKETPKKELAEMVLLVDKDGNGTVKKGDTVIHEGKAKMDMTKDPWEIDVTVAKGKDKGKVMKGIMKMKDKKMTVCWGAPGKDRPTEFKSEKGSGHILEVVEEVTE